MAGGDERLELVIGLAQAEIAAQVAEAVGIDGRAVGILAFDGAVIGALVAAGSSHLPVLDSSWGYPLMGLGASAVLAFAATLGGVDTGAELAEFYGRVRELEGETAVVEAQKIAAKDLIGTIDNNRGATRRKEGLAGLAVILLVLTIVTYGLSTAKLLAPVVGVLALAVLLGLFVYLVWLSFTFGG